MINTNLTTKKAESVWSFSKFRNMIVEHEWNKASEYWSSWWNSPEDLPCKLHIKDLIHSIEHLIAGKQYQLLKEVLLFIRLNVGALSKNLEDYKLQEKSVKEYNLSEIIGGVWDSDLKRFKPMIQAPLRRMNPYYNGESAPELNEDQYQTWKVIALHYLALQTSHNELIVNTSIEKIKSSRSEQSDLFIFGAFGMHEVLKRFENEEGIRIDTMYTPLNRWNVALHGQSNWNPLSVSRLYGHGKTAQWLKERFPNMAEIQSYNINNEKQQDFEWTLLESLLLHWTKNNTQVLKNTYCNPDLKNQALALQDLIQESNGDWINKSSKTVLFEVLSEEAKIAWNHIRNLPWHKRMQTTFSIWALELWKVDVSKMKGENDDKTPKLKTDGLKSWIKSWILSKEERQWIHEGLRMKEKKNKMPWWSDWLPDLGKQWREYQGHLESGGWDFKTIESWCCDQDESEIQKMMLGVWTQIQALNRFESNHEKRIEVLMNQWDYWLRLNPRWMMIPIRWEGSEGWYEFVPIEAMTEKIPEGLLSIQCLIRGLKAWKKEGEGVSFWQEWIKDLNSSEKAETFMKLWTELEDWRPHEIQCEKMRHHLFSTNQLTDALFWREWIRNDPDFLKFKINNQPILNWLEMQDSEIEKEWKSLELLEEEQDDLKSQIRALKSGIESYLLEKHLSLNNLDSNERCDGNESAKAKRL